MQGQATTDHRRRACEQVDWANMRTWVLAADRTLKDHYVDRDGRWVRRTREEAGDERLRRVTLTRSPHALLICYGFKSDDRRKSSDARRYARGKPCLSP